MDNKTLGQVAFEAYREVRMGEAYDGSIIPVWADLKEGIKDAWEVASLAVKDSVLFMVKEAGLK